MCLPTMTQEGREHAAQLHCIRLVHADSLRIVQQRQTMWSAYRGSSHLVAKFMHYTG